MLTILISDVLHRWYSFIFPPKYCIWATEGRSSQLCLLLCKMHRWKTLFFDSILLTLLSLSKARSLPIGSYICFIMLSQIYLLFEISSHPRRGFHFGVHTWGEDSDSELNWAHLVGSHVTAIIWIFFFLQSKTNARIYPAYHTAYDTFDYASKFIDPGEQCCLSFEKHIGFSCTILLVQP